MNKRLIALLALLAVTLPLHADFARIARAIDAQAGVKRIWIPFLGIARMAVRMIEPEGVNDFQLATFEGTANVDPRKLQQIMRAHVGPGFTPLVQVRSRRSGDWSFIYARPRGGDRIELMILAHDGGDTVLVRVDIDADTVARELQEHPRKVAHHARR